MTGETEGTLISFKEKRKQKVFKINGNFEIQMANGDKLIGGYKKDGGYAIWKSGDRFQSIESTPGNLK